MSCQFSIYLALSGIIAVFAVIHKFQLSFNGHTWLRFHLHRQNKNRFWFLHVFWLLCYCWLLFSHKQGGTTFEGVFCTGKQWGTWIYSDIRLVWQPLDFWYHFAFDLFLLWRPFALTLLIFSEDIRGRGSEMPLAAFVNRSKSHAKLLHTCSIQLASADLALDSKTFFFLNLISR